MMIKKYILIRNILIVFFAFCMVSGFAQVKPKYMWFDCEANFARLSYPDSIAFYLDKLKEVGFTDVIADVKSIMGETLFKSKYAPYMKEWEGVTRNENYDMLEIFIREGHKRNIKVHASLNVFCGGHLYKGKGIIYNEHPEWQSQVYWKDKIIPISQAKLNYNGMLNPALPEVQTYEMNILKEVVANYKELDGIVLDRVRYDGITSDFSQASKEMFEKYAGIKVKNFPADIIYWEKDENGNDTWKPGKYFNQWIEWRASVIYNFMARAKKEIKSISPKLLFGDYTGSWYPVYYEVGVNWASNTYDPSRDYSWATKTYKNYGSAELLDVYISGFYYTEVTIDDVAKADQVKNRTEAGMGKTRDYWYSVEGAARLSKEVVKNAVPVTGSIYVDQYGKDAGLFRKAVTMALKSSDGLMIFDIVHIIDKGWWNELLAGIKDAE
jgi:hypothetical protein